MTVWDNTRHPTDAEIDARRIAIFAVCDRIDSLACDEDSTFADFEALRTSIKFLPAATLTLLSAVADAYLAAGRLEAHRPHL
jgi:hypothetical protein